MVHEVFGIKNNRVDMSGAKGIKKELQVSVYSSYYMHYIDSHTIYSHFFIKIYIFVIS